MQRGVESKWSSRWSSTPDTYGTARHQTHIAEAMDHHGLTELIPFNCSIASLVGDLNILYVWFESSNTISGTVAEVRFITTDEHTLCERTQREDGYSEGEHQENCRSTWHIWLSTEVLC